MAKNMTTIKAVLRSISLSASILLVGFGLGVSAMTIVGKSERETIKAELKTELREALVGSPMITDRMNEIDAKARNALDVATDAFERLDQLETQNIKP